MPFTSDQTAAEFERLVADHELIGIVWAHLSDSAIGRAGRFADTPDPESINILFGEQTGMENFYRSLDGQIRPTIWAQGEIECYIDRTANRYIFGVFARRPENFPADFAKNYQKMKEICRQIKSRLENL